LPYLHACLCSSCYHAEWFEQQPFEGTRLLGIGEGGLTGLLEGDAGISKTDLLLELVTTNTAAGTFSVNLQVCLGGNSKALLLWPAIYN
jgi:hypothetical protein